SAQRTCSAAPRAPQFANELRGGTARSNRRNQGHGSGSSSLAVTLIGSLTIRRHVPQRRLGRGQAGDWDAPGRAAHVVHAHLVAERNGGRIAALLTTDANLETRPL